MATEFHRAQRKATAFAELVTARDAVAEALGIDADPQPNLTGAAARDPEVVQITKIERITEFLKRILDVVKENTVEGETEAEKTLGEISNVLKAFATGDETPLETLYKLSKSREDFKMQVADLEARFDGVRARTESATDQLLHEHIEVLDFQIANNQANAKLAEQTSKIAELEAKNVELEGKLAKKAK
jgi:predicted  nucleic acid-binding Zn-ribbon protein